MRPRSASPRRLHDWKGRDDGDRDNKATQDTTDITLFWKAIRSPEKQLEIDLKKGYDKVVS